LKILVISGNKIENIPPLATFESLEELNIGYNPIVDLSPLAALKKLRILDISRTGMHPERAFAGLGKSERIELEDKPRDLDLAFLTSLPQLRTLYVPGAFWQLPATGLEKIEKLSLHVKTQANFDAVFRLTTLKSLRIVYGETKLDSSKVARLTELEELDISHVVDWGKSFQITDISYLAPLTKLRSLKLNNHNVTDISVVASMTKLEILECTANQIEDISSLAGHPLLTELVLIGNKIQNVDALAGLTGLRKLDLGGNKISDISALQNLKDLEELGLSKNQISDITIVTKLAKLERLVLTANKISDLSPISSLKKLEHFNFEDNPGKKAPSQGMNSDYY
jgi:internalin A